MSGAEEMRRIDAGSLDEFVRSYVANEIGVSTGLISDGLRLEELGLSSNQLMELVYELEESLDVVFDQADLERIVTLGDLVSLALATAAHVRVAE